MKLNDIFVLSLNNLTHRGLRSWLTILGIIVGVAAVIAMMSIGAGMSSQVEDQMSGMGTDILTVSTGFTMAQGPAGGFEAMRERFNEEFSRGAPGRGIIEQETDDPALTYTDIYAVSQAAGVELVAGTISGTRVEVWYLAEEVSLTFEGVDPAAWEYMTTLTLASGRFLQEGDTTNVVIGSAVSDMFEQELSVNSQIRIEGKMFTVVGILEESGTGGFGNTDRAIYMTNTMAREFTDDLEDDEFSSLEVKISNPDQVDQIIENIENVLYASRMVDEDTKDFTVTSPTSMIETVTETMETISFFLVGIAAISLIVGAIGIANTMFMSVMERTRLIGIFKSLGTRNSEILKLFLTESAIIGFMGGLLGVFLGLILVGFISGAGLSFMGGGNMMGGGLTNTSVAIVTPELIIFSLLFSTVIGIVSGLIPARQAAKLQIVEAMRSE